MTNDKRQGVLQGLAQLILIRHLRRETGTPSFFYNKVMKRYYLVRVTSGLISSAAAAVLFTVLVKLWVLHPVKRMLGRMSVTYLPAYLFTCMIAALGTGLVILFLRAGRAAFAMAFHAAAENIDPPVIAYPAAIIAGVLVLACEIVSFSILILWWGIRLAITHGKTALQAEDVPWNTEDKPEESLDVFVPCLIGMFAAGVFLPWAVPKAFYGAVSGFCIVSDKLTEKAAPAMKAWILPESKAAASGKTDPFEAVLLNKDGEGLVLSMKGISPDITLSLKNTYSSKDERSHLLYRADKTFGIKNGDTITITARDFRTNSTRMLSKTSYTLQVKGQDTYVGSMEDVTDAVRAKAQSAALAELSTRKGSSSPDQGIVFSDLYASFQEEAASLFVVYETNESAACSYVWLYGEGENRPVVSKTGACDLSGMSAVSGGVYTSKEQALQEIKLLCHGAKLQKVK